MQPQLQQQQQAAKSKNVVTNHIKAYVCVLPLLLFSDHIELCAFFRSFFLSLHLNQVEMPSTFIVSRKIYIDHLIVNMW